MLKRIGLSSLLLLIAAGVVHGGGTDSDADAAAMAMVTGTVTYRERIALPADAVLRVQLRDVSKMDVAATILSEQVIEPKQSVPIPFALPYDPDDIDERMSYSVFADIRSGGKLLFISDTHNAVLTRGSPNQIDVVLIRTR